MYPARVFAVLVSLCLLTVPASAKPASEAPEVEAAALVEGVRTIALPGVPGTLTVFGPEAFGVVEARSSGRVVPLVAAARYGKGRAVLFGHGYFGDALNVGDTAKLVGNLLRWAGGGKETTRVGLRRHGGAAPVLRDAGFDVVVLDGADWTKRLQGVDVVVLPLADLNEKQVDLVRRRLKAGLGVVGGMPGWGWQQLNPGKSLAEENMGNRLLAPAGLVWGGEYVEKPAGGVLEVSGPASPWTHAGRALDALVAQAAGRAGLSRADGATAVATLTRALREIPTRDRLLLPRLRKQLEGVDADSCLPSHDDPVTDADGLARLRLALDVRAAQAALPGDVEAHAAASAFPGEVPKGARRVRHGLLLDTSVPLWHGTGLYAAPGEVVTLTVPKEAVGTGLALRIGAHKDRLWGKPKWHRAPEITRTFPVTAARTEGACAFGGLVYVEVPVGSTLGEIQVQVAGAVEAPRFVSGTTTLDEWRTKERRHPAPWAELETSKVILTVPSDEVRELDDPEALMRWWDRVMDGCADLAAIPRKRARPERYVTDEQISAGYMHAGYPIMTHLDAAPRFVDLERLSTRGDWGMFHEMGHNHQSRDWTFSGTGEVTVNLFSLYLMETVCEKGVGHTAMSPESIEKNRALYQESGLDFGLWKRKPFLALVMYYELRQAFGWEAYRKVFAAYRDLAPGERPRSDAEKRDQWLVRMSRTVGRDLGPFFASWGVPVSEAARAEVSVLPAWMPE